MKNYIKPNMDLTKITPDATIAATTGLSSWLEGNELNAAENITTFEYISE